MSPKNEGRLRNVTAGLLGAAVAARVRDDQAPVTVHDLRRLTGGASRETWSFDVELANGIVVPLILGRDTSVQPLALTRIQEAAVLQAAERAGVPVPHVLFVLEGGDEDRAVGPGYVMEQIEGETIPRKILRDDFFADARHRLVSQCGAALARVHAVDVVELGFLDRPDPVLQYVQVLSGIAEPHPAFELGLRWLAKNRPPDVDDGLVHGDFRLGNFIVGDDGLRAVIDWELAHIGDPMEDLGWLCVRSWRFGNDDLPVGGFGHRDDLFSAYEALGGRPVDPEHVRYWEVFGNLKWGIICLVQCMSHISGLRPSVELATLGRRACEMEYDLLGLIVGDGEADGEAAMDPASVPQDMPPAADLVAAVREFLAEDVLEEVSGRNRFNTRVSVTALGIVERELRARHPDDDEAMTARAELAQAIRAGERDDDIETLAVELLAESRAKLAVANPGY